MLNLTLKLNKRVPTKLKIMFYVALGVIACCLGTIVIAPMYITGYFWPGWLLPLAFQIPTVFSILSVNKEFNDIERENSKKDTNMC